MNPLSKLIGILVSAIAIAGLLNSRRGYGAAPEGQPNVVFVFTDDQGYGNLSCHGNPHLKTPAMDAIWKESVRLTDFHVDPTCSPTRAALMTGRYSHRAHVWHTIQGRDRLHPDEVTMADVFRHNGYRTALFGKWHLGNGYPYRPVDRGFDYAIARANNWYNDRHHDTYTDYQREWKEEGFTPAVLFQHAIGYIRDHKNDPLFIMINTYVPHLDWSIKEEWAKPFLDRGLPASVAAYYASIEQLDAALGAFRRQLREEGLEDNTLLIFLTDNGTSNSDPANFNAGMRGHKGSVYEGGHRVPCFWYGPSLGLSGPGRDVNTLTAHVDILPTLIDLLGLTPLREVAYDGASIVPLLREDTTSWPDRILHVESQRIPFPEKWRKSCIMTERWRLINGHELYDLQADFAQERDVSEDYPALVNSFRQYYDELWKGLTYRDKEFCRVTIGHPSEKVSTLSSSDWLPTAVNAPWRKVEHYAAGIDWNGYHMLNVHEAGAYEFRLRRWPKETRGKIRSTIEPYEPSLVFNEGGQIVPYTFPAGTALPIVEAVVKVNEQEKRATVTDQDEVIAMRFELPQGEIKLEAWFRDENDIVRGVYYLEAEKLH